MESKSDMPEDRIDLLVVRSQKGDAEAFGELYDILINSIYRYIYYRANQREVEDLTELVFLKVWENIRKYKKGNTTFKAWVFRIAHNLLVDHYRTHRSISSLDYNIRDMRKESDPVHVAELQLNNEILVSALAKLKKNYREVLVLKFINELENDEIARVLNKREGSVRVLQFRALNALRKELESSGVNWL